MFVTGPDVVKTVTHEDVTKKELGGAVTHNTKSGVAHFMSEDDAQSLMTVRELLSFLPSNNMEEAPLKPTNDPADRTDEKLMDLIPSDPNKPYDIKEIIESVCDNNYFFEVQEHYAQNIVIGYGRLGGRSVGFVANQPASYAGVLDINSSIKAARFVRFCDAFNIPLITFVDVPGFLPGTAQEFGGIIKHGAKLLYAFSEATVPKITLITRKGYGGAYDVMNSKHIGADVNYAYPTAEIAVMGAQGAVNILYRNLETEEDRQKAIEEYEEAFANPYKAAELGYVDEIILPKDTRKKLIDALEMTKNKRETNPPKKHGNIPL
jgi:propionyl-CoA carboxylase beta chain